MDKYLEYIKQRYKEALVAQEEHRKTPIIKGYGYKELHLCFAVIEWQQRIAEYIVFGKKYDSEPKIPCSNYEDYM